MSDALKKIERAREAIAPAWTAERERRVGQRVATSRHRRAVARRVGVAAAVVLVAGGAVVLALSRASDRGPVAATVQFADGSTAELLSAAARVTVVTDGPDSVVAEVAAGGARFDVVHREGRRFVVRSGDVQVEVIGTRFVVERDAGRVTVSVERGQVRVRSGAISRAVSAGERASFPPEQALAVPPAPAPAAAPQPAAAAPAPPAAPPPDWRPLARKGDFDRAFDAMHRQGPTAVRDDPADLLLASDVARLSGHPELALAPLKRLIDRHRKDARAPLAAFTLGRVLLEELGRPREAADAFHLAVTLQANGQLAEDALARETEAWSRAGEVELAREAAAVYLKRYPGGQRAQSVRRYGGVE